MQKIMVIIFYRSFCLLFEQERGRVMNNDPIHPMRPEHPSTENTFLRELPFSLPPLFLTETGERIRTATEWREKRRPQILELFAAHVYGRVPVEKPDSLRFAVDAVIPDLFSGKAARKEVRISFSGPGGEGRIRVFVTLPTGYAQPVPVFFLICHLPPEYIDLRETTPFWPVEEIIKRGYAAVAFYTADVDPDVDDGFRNGVHGVFARPGETRSPDAWGTIAAWAWGARRVMDYLESEPAVDSRRVAVVGHSRGGKTALWAGANDERFALVISNSSGCTGAALARHKQGETVEKINTAFPHWFCENYKKFNNREEQLPVDQHQLLALIAPRRLYINSASEDAWADPEGEFLSCLHAEPVYNLSGLPGLGVTAMPEPGSVLHDGYIGYHLRKGRHELGFYDWQRYLDYADRHWRKF